jgi:hypothetical protein
MAKKTPEQHFRDLFNMANDPAASQNEHDKAERSWKAWLKRRGKTGRDIGAVLLQADEDDKKQNPPPPPPDPRTDASVHFDPERHNSASLVEELLKAYVTMQEYVRVIYSLAICLTHVIHGRFSIAPRVVTSSRKGGCGKTTALEIARRLVFRPNSEAIGTGPAIEDDFVQGPCALMLDETKHADAATRRRLQRIWNVGHTEGPSSVISKMVAGKKRSVSLFGMVFLAGTDKGIGRLLAAQEQTRTLWLEMRKYTEETMPPRNYWIKEERDDRSIRCCAVGRRRRSSTLSRQCHQK